MRNAVSFLWLATAELSLNLTFYWFRLNDSWGYTCKELAIGSPGVNATEHI